MKKQLIEKWVTACDKLIKSYKEDVVILCPLCLLVPGRCQDCLWKIFERKYCLVGDGLETEVEDRIRRLRRWRRRLNKMLKDGGK